MSVTSPLSIARDEDLKTLPADSEDELEGDSEFDSFEELDEIGLEVREDNTRP
jgi:hypothetical protein